MNWTVDENGNKRPTNPYTGHFADFRDPKNWAPFEEAVSRGNLGLVLSDGDFFLDIDDCIDDRGRLSSFADDVVRQNPHIYTEISSSGRGLHLIGKFRGDARELRCRPKGSSQFELYMRDRCACLTGNALVRGVPLDADGTALVDQLIRDYQLRREPAEPSAAGGKSSLSDDQVLGGLLQHRTSLSGAPSGYDLYHGEDLGRWYPSATEGRDYDHSAADLALLSHLAFWTNRDVEQMDRLFRGSALYREKWERDDYRENSLGLAISGTSNTYSPNSSDKAPEHDTLPDRHDSSVPDLVLVIGENKALTCDGFMLTPEQVNTRFGGGRWVLDELGRRTTTKAWEAVAFNPTHNPPKAMATRFRPDMPFRHFFEENGVRYVNRYFYVPAERRDGDPSPFTEHVRRLCANQQDYDITMAYLAALVQHAGEKFGWMLILQGTHGNGKSYLLNAIQHALGIRYSYLSRASKIESQFNAWLDGKLFVGFHELEGDRQAVTSTLKEMIGATLLEVEGKNQNQELRDNYANFLACTQHLDAIIKTKDSRHFCVVATAQQSASDLEASGFDSAYFNELWEWSNRGGWPIVGHYLAQYPIPPELNPARGCRRAPRTSQEDRILDLGVGRIEGEILEAVAQGRPGFRGGWISSAALDRLLGELGLALKFPRRKRRDVLQELGYLQHPGLPGGRATTTTILDGSRPTLYATLETIGASLDYPVRCYEAAQS